MATNNGLINRVFTKYRQDQRSYSKTTIEILDEIQVELETEISKALPPTLNKFLFNGEEIKEYLLGENND